MAKACREEEGNSKGAWSKEEDEKLMEYVQRNGEGSWNSLPKAAGLRRCGKSCRGRWVNHLKQDPKKGKFGEDEDDLIVRLHSLLGDRWSLIAGRLPGRTENEVKNHWKFHLRKKLQKMGHNLNNTSCLRNIKSNVGKSSSWKNRPAFLTISCNNNNISESTSSNGITSIVPDLNLDLTLSSTPTSIGERSNFARPGGGN